MTTRDVLLGLLHFLYALPSLTSFSLVDSDVQYFIDYIAWAPTTGVILDMK